MSSTWVVEFHGAPPSDEEIAAALQAYVGEAGSLLAHEQDDDWNGPGWSVVLVGRPSDAHPLLNAALEHQGHTQRWFVVERAGAFSGLFVTAYAGSDTFTHVVAAGFASMAARLWKGKEIPPG